MNISRLNNRLFAIVHPKLIVESRSRMKIMLLDAKKDIPVKTIATILKMAINFADKKYT